MLASRRIKEQRDLMSLVIVKGLAFYTFIKAKHLAKDLCDRLVKIYDFYSFVLI